MGREAPEASYYRQLPPGPGLSREKVAAHQRARLQQAMVELVAAYGYEDLTVRGLAKRARISSGTFYKHYRGTDDCLLATFDVICKQISERLVTAGRNEPDSNRRLELAVVRLFRDMTAFPEVVTFMLRAAPAAGPAFASGLRNSATRIGTALELCVCSESNASLHPLLREAMVAGLARIGRALLPTAGKEEVTEVSAEAVEWIRGLSTLPLERTRRAIVTDPSEGRLDRSGSRFALDADWPDTLGDERALILAAAFRTAKRGYHQLSVRDICREAGVSRRIFNRHFRDLEHCYLSAVEDRAERATAKALRGISPSAAWSDTVIEAIGTLCRAIQDDRDGARALFVEITAAGTRGMESRDRLISKLARLLKATAPRGRSPSGLAAEASAAAVWTILRRRVQDQSPATAAALPVLSHLVLAPATRSTSTSTFPAMGEIRDI